MIKLIKWLCPFCNCMWWEKDDNKISANTCVYCGKGFEKEYVENTR